jgi:succinate-semialdehyde dehydrogenase/glutarate-semialdehyde dehydrogenase
MYYTEDADMDKMNGCCYRMNNNGQCCVASKRFIAVEAIADECSKNSRINYRK